MPGRDDEPTFDVLATGAFTGVGAAAPRPSTAPTPPADAFVPGSIVAGRYRLVALLGRGGMGAVYRADDLTLGQPVALKFLPGSVADGDARLAQFHNELRVARQVSHRHVCRLYDLGESDGRRFLTMEYVDGEDLASLLRRVGRVPQDRAVQMARQLCAGIAAAHERGVLHRDLKPANVMIDADGDVRITDFGIATAKEGRLGFPADRAGQDVNSFAGTPQYMAPEQLSGEAASIKSDIYALGLILFELFTGKRVTDSRTLNELRQFHQSGTVTTPTTIVPDLDPAVERVIMRCLDRDPARRPPSALTVAAALPGGDPLAAALAAGETPSPELLAAAGETEAIGVARGLLMVAAVIAGLLALAAASDRYSFVGRTPLDEPPDVLVDRAEAIAARAGYTDAAGDTAHGFVEHDDYTGWLRDNSRSPDRWDVVATGNPSAVLFWYRTSPRFLLPVEEDAVGPEDPVQAESGMRTIVLDPGGRLISLSAVPPRVEETNAASAPPPAPPWAALFDAAGLRIADFAPATPTFVPPHYADTRTAWQGPMPGRSDITLRVEAAAYRGTPVAFEVAGPWTVRAREREGGDSMMDAILISLFVAVLVTLIAVAGVLARRHLRSRRADRNGAAKLSAFLAIAGVLAWIVRANHVASPDEIGLFFRSAGPIAILTVIFWVVYLALEPYVRKFWPDALLGWSRLLAGHLRDPRVGRDVLAGLVFGVAITLVLASKDVIVPALGYGATYPALGVGIPVIGSSSAVVWAWLLESVDALGGALFAVLIIVTLRLALRRNLPAVAIATVLLSASALRDISALWMLVFPLAVGALVTFVAVRFGLLSLVVAEFTWSVLQPLPLTLDVAHWSAGVSNWTLGALTTIACLAFAAARGRLPLFGELVKDPD